MTSIQAKPAGPASGGRPGTLVPGRDRYLDLLRAIALVRIVALHTFFNAVWLTVVFPSLGVMFALAGALMARSLERPALEVLRSRTRRLLLPLWVYSLTVVGLLSLQGWRPAEGDAGGWWLRLMLWFVPLGDPPFPQVDPAASDYSALAWGGRCRRHPLVHPRVFLVRPAVPPAAQGVPALALGDTVLPARPHGPSRDRHGGPS
ncbi:acyltransferase family protein [Arthrobacter sp. CAN_A6]|uniref:acyltransferase family protein n=1 Tax=Arthrobacter sp. CAN_A6 TaxID=2787721 RepID=UPI002FEE6F52